MQINIKFAKIAVGSVSTNAEIDVREIPVWRIAVKVIKTA